jgi:outer membrane protein assembly factor BamB
MLRENVLVLDRNGLLALKLPELETVWSIPVPDKKYVDMRIVEDRLYLVTSNGEIMFIFNQK